MGLVVGSVFVVCIECSSLSWLYSPQFSMCTLRLYNASFMGAKSCASIWHRNGEKERFSSLLYDMCFWNWYINSKKNTDESLKCVITEKKGKVNLVKDDQAPKISELPAITIVKGNTIDYNQGVTISDNRDPNPALNIDSSQVDINKVGTYIAVYTVSDRSGNKIEKKRKIKVVENTTIGHNEQNGEKIVNLTFDDGPSANTQKILEILDRYNVKATFFVTGNNQAYNHLIKAAHDKGHTIALHTYCHDYPKIYASTSAYFDDLTKVGNMVKDLIGHVPKYVRFPGGASNTVSRKYCPGIMSVLSKELIARGYQYYDWNVDSTDASGNNVPVSKIVANATNSNANNINILFHDTAAKSTTVQALPAIIENYLSRGYRFEAINDSSFVPHQKVNN